MLVLMGGLNYFSKGIHLNMIEVASDPAQESWENINSINDVVQRVLTCSKRVTVSAMVENGGAGGVKFAIAADLVWVHGNVVVHPSCTGPSTGRTSHRNEWVGKWRGRW